MSVQKAPAIWDSVLGELQLKVTRPSYETWLRGTKGISYADGEFVVGAPNTFVAEMLEQRMYSLITRAVERLTDKGVEVSFQVRPPDSNRHAGGGDNPQSQSPVAGASEAPTQRVPAETTARNGNIELNGRYTFDNFIVGKSNDLAYAAAMAVAENPGITYNPLVIYSGVGLGKTHLLHAIGHYVRLAGVAPIYTTTEEFTNEYIKAIREGKTEEFRDRYRSADLLLLDDIQFIIGKEQTQEGFFHTFNALHMAGRQLVISSDRPVTELTLLEDRVRSRLTGGLVVDIQPPDLETRLAILRAKCEETDREFPPDVLEFLAGRFHKNIRELEGHLNRIAAFADLINSPITLDLVKRALADTLTRSRSRRISDTLVLDVVSSYFDIDKAALIGRRRDKVTAFARHVTMYLLREEAQMPLAAIGRVLGGKDHTTVLHGYHRISSQLDTDKNLRHDVINLQETLSKS